jgi:hypothetical protein
MAQLTADTPRVFESTVNEFNEVPADDALTIYAGSMVGEVSSTGLYRQLVAGDNFAGFAVEKCDNSAGADGAKNIKVRQRGYVKMAVTGASAFAQNGDTVYASDGNTLTTASTGNSTVGKIYRWVVSTTCIVYFEAVSVRSI